MEVIREMGRGEVREVERERWREERWQGMKRTGECKMERSAIKRQGRRDCAT